MSDKIPMPHINTLFLVQKKLDDNAKPFVLRDLSLSVSRVLSCTVIYLDLPSPISSSDIHGNPPDGQPYTADAQSCSGWGLHGIPRYRDIGELLPRLSILTRLSLAVYFCCTILEVASTWRYQAPCPMLLGLSSWSKKTPRPYNKLKSFSIIALFSKKIT